ncbi:MAG: tetratricopeptide repeat protein [candidate division WOR-3 bacterium]
MNSQSLADWLRNRRGMALVLTAVALVNLILYLPTLRFDFVWDDNLLIVNNRLLQESSFAQIFTRGYWAGVEEVEEGPVAAYYRPIATLSFWLDWKLAGLSPLYFHLINLVIATAAAIFGALIVWELLHSAVWAFIAGTIFATHPAHVEAVAYISGRTDLLATLFLGFASFALLRSFRKKNRLWWLVLPPCFALALLSKETAILFPLLVSFTPLFIQSRPQKQYWLLVLILIAIALAYLYLRQLLFNTFLPLPTTLTAFNLLNIANTFGYYIRMFFVPFTHYARIPPDPNFLELSNHFIWALLFLISVPLAALRRRFQIALWPYTWTTLFLLPVINIFPLGLQAAERLLFLPSVGLIALVIVILSRLLVAHHRIREVVGTLLLIAAIAFGFNTKNRLGVWRNEVTLFSAMVNEAPKAPTAYYHLARALSPTLPDSAIKLYNRAILLDQGFARAHINIAVLYTNKGDFRRALHHLRLANELQPNSPLIHTHLTYTFLLAGEIDSALLALQRASPPDSTLLQPLTSTPNQALLFSRLGTIPLSLGDTAAASTCYQKALQLDSNCLPALYNLALIALARQDTAKALQLLTRAKKIQPHIQQLPELQPLLRTNRD